MEYVLRWLYGAAAVTCVLFFAYVIVQQAYREGLNDPQVQMAEDAVSKLSSGGVPADIVPHGTPLIDISRSLFPWVAVYDSQGAPLESSAELNGAPPKLPQGVFDDSRWLRHPNGLFFNQSPALQNRFTWQPEGGVRQAVILARAGNGMYVAAGRNMREVEQRIEHEGEIVGVGWLGTLVALAVVQLLYVFVRGTAQGGRGRG